MADKKYSLTAKSAKPNPFSVAFGNSAQSTIEFTFALMGVVLLIVGMIKVFAWTGDDLQARRKAHDRNLRLRVSQSGWDEPLKQIKPNFFGSTKIKGVTVASDIFGN